MTNKFSTIALGTMLGFSTIAFTGTSASAAAMLPLSPVVNGQANAASDGVVQVNHRKKKWHNNNDNWQYRKHRRGYNNGVYLSLPLILGGAYAANRYYGDDYYDNGYYGYDDGGYGDYGDYGGGLSSRHVRYCLNRYQSYNPRNNTWLSNSGRVRQCRSPFL